MFVLDRIGPEPEADVWYGGLAFTPDGTLLAGRSNNAQRERTLLAWDTSARRARWVVPVTDPPVHVAVDRSGERMATAYQKRTWLWDARTGGAIGVLDDHDEAYAPIAWLPGDRLLASTRPDEGAASLVVWDVRARRRVGRVASPLPGFARALAVDPSGARVVVFGEGALSAWDLASGEKIHAFAAAVGTHPYPSWTTPLLFHPDGRRVIAGGILGEEGPVVFDAATGEKLLALRGPKPPSDACALAVSQNGRWLVGSYGWQADDHRPWQDVGLRIWDLESDNAHPQRIRMEGGPLGQLAFSADGTLLAAASLGALHVWAVHVEPASEGHGRVNPSVG